MYVINYIRPFAEHKRADWFDVFNIGKLEKTFAGGDLEAIRASFSFKLFLKALPPERLIHATRLPARRRDSGSPF